MSDSLPTSAVREPEFRTGSGAICAAHITDASLLSQLETTDPLACEFCEEIAVGVTVDSLENALIDAVYYLYQSPDEAGVSYVTAEGGYGGAEIIESWDAVHDLTEFAIDDDYHYHFVTLYTPLVGDPLLTPRFQEDDPEISAWAWKQFEADVKSGSRFIFFESSTLSTSTPSSRSADFLMGLRRFLDPEYGLVKVLETGTEFFRGRLTKDADSNLSSAKDLGPATPEIAAANRMSPAGIPMFYASQHPETAVAEIASHAVRNFARIGTFKNTRPLEILDLSVPPRLYSPFDVDNRHKNNFLQFLIEFAQNVAKPIIPDGRPHVEYVPTQVITELFRWTPGYDLDGIKLASAQDGKDSFVFFYDALYVADEGADETTSLPKPAPVFILDPDSVRTYRIKRNIVATAIQTSEPKMVAAPPPELL